MPEVVAWPGNSSGRRPRTRVAFPRAFYANRWWNRPHERPRKRSHGEIAPTWKPRSSSRCVADPSSDLLKSDPPLAPLPHSLHHRRVEKSWQKRNRVACCWRTLVDWVRRSRDRALDPLIGRSFRYLLHPRMARRAGIPSIRFHGRRRPRRGTSHPPLATPHPLTSVQQDFEAAEKKALRSGATKFFKEVRRLDRSLPHQIVR